MAQGPPGYKSHQNSAFVLTGDLWYDNGEGGSSFMAR